MAASVTYHARLEYTDQFGNTKTLRNNAGLGKVLSDLDEVQEITKRLTSTTAAVLWDANDEQGWDSFRFLWIEGDAEIEIEFTVDDPTTDHLFVVTAQADTPLVLSDDASFHTAVGGDMFAGTAANIDRIRAKMPNASAANVRLVLGR